MPVRGAFLVIGSIAIAGIVGGLVSSPATTSAT